MDLDHATTSSFNKNFILTAWPPTIEAGPATRATFLTAAGNRRSHKVHKWLNRLAATDAPGIQSTGYDAGSKFGHSTVTIHTLDDLHSALEQFSRRNAFFIRGSVREGAPASINRRTKKDGADIQDTASRIIPIDLDAEAAPANLDTSSILEVAEYLRGRLPPELQDASCIIQLSASYGLWNFSNGPRTLKARLWFLNDEPLSSAQLRRWFKFHNASGSTAIMDTVTATPGQPIYIAPPTFVGMQDPVPLRLALLLDETDTVRLVIPPEPRREPAPIPEGEPVRDTGVLKPLVNLVRSALDGAKHTALNLAAYTAGGFVGAGTVTEQEARQALQTAISSKANVENLTAAFETIDQALLDGQERPLYPAVPPQYRQPETATETLSVDAAVEKVRATVADLIAHPLKDGTPRKLILKAPAGTGKTRAAIDEVIQTHTSALILTPTHKLSDQSATWINQQSEGLNPYHARAVRGRTALNPDGAPGERMCQRHQEISALRKANLGESEFSLLCSNPRAGAQELTTCPFIKNCAYLDQAKGLPPAVVGTHPLLFQKSSKILADHKPDILVIDESFQKSLINKTHWSIGTLRQEGGIVATIADSLAQGEPLQDAIKQLMDKETGPETERRQRLLAKLEAWRDTLPPIDRNHTVYPGAPNNLAAIERHREKADPRLKLYAFGRALKAAIENGHGNALWFADAYIKNGDSYPAALYARWINPLPERTVPMLFLDATASKEWYEAALNCEVEFVDIGLPPPATKVVQITDSTLPKRHLVKGSWQKRIIAFANAQPGTVGLISHKAVIEAMRPHLGANILTAHFNALEGLDVLKDCDVLIVAGRIEPAASELEADARALWPTHSLTIQKGKRGDSQLVRSASRYRMRDGTTVPCTVRMHPDPKANLLLQLHRDGGLVQAIGRLRHVHCQKPQTLVMLTSVPVHGIEVDELVKADELLPSERLAKLLIKTDGVLPLSPAWLSANLKDEFCSEGAAHRWWHDENLRGTNAYIIKKGDSPYRQTYPLNPPWRIIQYRVSGQRGSPTQALVTGRYSDQEVLASLEQNHGKPVTLITQEPEPMEAPQQEPNPMEAFIAATPMAEAIAQARQAKAAEPPTATPRPAKPETWIGRALWRASRKQMETVERFATVSRLREGLMAGYGKIDEFKQVQKLHWHSAPC